MNENLESEKTFLKLHSASSDGGQEQPPMDDASFTSGQPGLDQGMGMDPSMGVDPNAMGGDPGMGMDPGMSGDPGMDPGMGGDPNAMGGDPNAMGGDPGMGMDPSMEQGGTGDDTVSIIKQLSPTDKEAVRSYAESMLNRDESQNGGDAGGQEQPMMEQVIFTKKQIQKIHENFGPSQDELNKETQNNRKELPKKTTKTTSGNSPFRPKQFKS